MKLELKHLAPYLPYRLKGICTWEHLNKDFEVELYSASSNILNISSPFGGNDYVEINEFKPILRTLSDLIKEIQHNGEKFVPINTIKIFTDLNHFEYVERFIYDEETFGLLPYWVMELLLEWNFDIFGLIPHGLAVDINTLNK